MGYVRVVQRKRKKSAAAADAQGSEHEDPHCTEARGETETPTDVVVRRPGNKSGLRGTGRGFLAPIREEATDSDGRGAESSDFASVSSGVASETGWSSGVGSSSQCTSSVGSEGTEVEEEGRLGPGPGSFAYACASPMARVSRESADGPARETRETPADFMSSITDLPRTDLNPWRMVDIV